MAMLMVGTSASSLAAVTPDPSSLTYGLQDISASDAGRVHDGTNRMYKMRTSQKRKLQLTWTLITAEQASAILQAFNPEYVHVRYFDVLDGQLETREFYVGDRTAPFKWYQIPGQTYGTRVSTLSFDIIER